MGQEFLTICKSNGLSHVSENAFDSSVNSVNRACLHWSYLPNDAYICYLTMISCSLLSQEYCKPIGCLENIEKTTLPYWLSVFCQNAIVGNR